MTDAGSKQSKLQEYARPDVLVSTEWVSQHLGDKGIRLVEVDEDVLLYEQGHVPGAVKLDWHTELQYQDRRDFVDAETFADLMASKGISNDTTVVLYGDKSNWWAAYEAGALWVVAVSGGADSPLIR